MKRLMAFLLISLLLMSLVVAATADGNAKIFGDTVVCKAGDTISYSVNISGNPGIVAYGIGVLCESDWFYFDEEVTQGEFTADGSTISSPDIRLQNVAWYNTDDVTGDGTLFSFNIHVSPSTPSGDYPINIYLDQGSTINGSYEEIPFEVLDGCITVEEAELTAEDILEFAEATNKDSKESTCTLWYILGGVLVFAGITLFAVLKKKNGKK